MIDFYFVSNITLTLLFVFCSVLVALQASTVWIIAFYNFKKRFFEFLAEMSLLVYCIVLARSPVFVMLNREQGIIDGNSFTPSVYLCGLVVVLAFTFYSITKKRLFYTELSGVLITLPVFSSFSIYVPCFVIGVVALFFRAFKTVGKEQYRKKTEISAFSVKEGIDLLPSGVMYYGNDGHIFLVNTRMLDLMDEYFGQEQKNGIQFWHDLIQKKVVTATTHIFENSVLLRSELATWCFSKDTFISDGVQYTELLAVNITELDKGILALEKDTEMLINQNKEIQVLSDNIVTLKENQEYSRIRSQIHDVMGQRLTAIQRLLQTETPTHCGEIIPLLQNIVENIREENTESAGELLLELTLYFKRVGVIIEIEGTLPKDESIAYLFLSVLREATTNAARHANATIVKAKIEHLGNFYMLEISNNGKKPEKETAEGGGLSGIRKRVEACNGILTISWKPFFKILIKVKIDTINNKEYKSD